MSVRLRTVLQSKLLIIEKKVPFGHLFGV